jgi:hypothetical protein
MRPVLFLSLGLLVLGGCASKKKAATLTGTITYNGQPLNGGTLKFYNTAGETPPFSLKVTQKGTFRSSDVPPGNYKIVVEGSPGFTPNTSGLSPEQLAAQKAEIEKRSTPATIPFPDKYKKRTSTPLTAEVGASNQELKLELTD